MVFCLIKKFKYSMHACMWAGYSVSGRAVSGYGKAWFCSCSLLSFHSL